MPGSQILCQGLPVAYNNLFFIANPLSANQHLGMEIINDTINSVTQTLNGSPVLGTPLQFPFSTGDIVYYSVNLSSSTEFVKYFAIKISPTQIKLATSYANAMNGVSVALSPSDSTSVGFFTRMLSSSYLAFQSGPGIGSFNTFLKSNWQSSAYSTQTFFVQDKVEIKFDLDTYCFCGLASLQTTNEFPNYAIGVAIDQDRRVIGRESTGSLSTNRFNSANSISGIVSIRIKINQGVVSVAVLVNNVYSTLYSTSLNPTNLPLRIFSFHSHNNTGLRNCTVAYL